MKRVWLLIQVPLLLLMFAASPARAEIDFDQLKGKVVYLDFWASWCGPCRESFPWMEKMHQHYKDQGLEVIAVNLDQEPGLAQAFLKKFPVDFRIETDPKGELATYFKVETMPTSVIIDRQGNARFSHLGFHNDRSQGYEQEIRQLLEEQ